MLEFEKAGDPWHRDREPLAKKLKTAETKLAGPRSAKPSLHSRSGSAAGSASPSETSDSESDDDSEYYSESGGEVELDEPSPLPASRPANPHEAVEYDVIKAVWAKKSVTLSGTVIRTALGEYWDIFKGIRDKWKTKAANLTQAIDKKDQTNIKTYERRVTDQRRLLESAMRLTLKHGHPDIIERLGENPGFLLIFYQFLADRFKESEYTGGLIAASLELLTKCITIDQSILEKTNLHKALPRIIKRGDDFGKSLAQKILDNAADVSRQKAPEIKGTKKQQPNDLMGKSQIDEFLPTDGNDTKAARSSETKKVSAIPGKGPAISTTTKLASQVAGKVETKIGSKSTGSDAPVSKVKANVITAKPSGFFSSLKSASKKPGTSAKAEDKQNSTGPNIKVEAKAEPPKPAFSFAATMAALHTQKEEQPIKSEENRKPETAEERKKRIRKEARRKFRVSWKDDDALVEVREFVHDPDEEMGHEDSQVRDVGDSRGEGQMLKMHKDREEMINEDEDYEPPEEMFLPDWQPPTVIDFSEINDADLARNITSRGGDVEVKSHERAVQEQRELTTLMVIHTGLSDIPPSPREPSDLSSVSDKPEGLFGEPGAVIKERETEYSARQNSRAPLPDVSALLRMINGQKEPQPIPQPQPVAAPVASSALHALFAQIAKSNTQQPAPQMQVLQPQQQQPFNLQAALANMPLPSQPQQNYAAPPASVANLQAMLAQFGGQPAQQPPQMQGYGYPNQYQAENDRKRQLDQEDNDHAYKRSRGSGPGNKKFVFKGEPTVQCKFWHEGKCRKGDDCTFLHE